MALYDDIKKYSGTVCKQIKWKKARTAVAEEIENHICDQRNAYMRLGENEADATEKAIVQMGDAIAVGQELDKTHRPKPQWVMVALTAAFLMTGILSNYFLSSSGDVLFGFRIIPYIAAFGVFLLCYKMDFTILGKYAIPIAIAILVLSIGIIVGISLLGSGSYENGALRMRLPFGIFSLRPAYLALIFPMAYALFIYVMKNRGYAGIVACGFFYLPFAGILMYIPTLYGFTLFTLSALFALCLAVTKGWFNVNKKMGFMLIIIPTTIVISCTISYAFARDGYLLQRISSFLGFYSEPYGNGYLASTTQTILSGSAFAGKGSASPALVEQLASDFGASYMVTLLIHSFGWIVLVGICLAIAAFLSVGIHKILHQKSILSALVCSSALLPFILQTVFYIVDNLGWGTTAAFSLPLISYGKAALLINAALIGIMLSVFRTGHAYEDSRPCPELRDQKI